MFSSFYFDVCCFYNGFFPKIIYPAHHHSRVIGSAKPVDGEVPRCDVVSCVQSLIVLVPRSHCGGVSSRMRNMLRKKDCKNLCFGCTALVGHIVQTLCATRRLVILMTTSVEAKQWLE